MKRKISALLAADIVKYSRLVADDEEETVHRLADYRAVFGEVTSRHGGRIVNMVGDAVLADFSSSVDAVRCALDVQQAIDAHNRAFPDDRRMQVRIGVTLADIMDQEGELFGDGVNIAARLESLAPPGGICVSQTVREQVSGKLPVAFTDIGPQRVKNLPNPIHAFVFVSQTEGAGASGRTRLKGLRTRKGRLLAVAATLAVAFAASIVAALQFREPGQAARWMPASLASQPPAAAVRTALRFDREKVRALAEKQAIPLPKNLKVLAPPASVPAHLADYLGAWGGEQRWTANGRQVMLIVESIDESGTALGFFAHSVPLVPNAVTQDTARFTPFASTVTDAGLHFVWRQSKYTFRLMPDGSMMGELDTTNSRGQVNLSITLDRIE
jgi:class 3 adenylate cyclase